MPRARGVLGCCVAGGFARSCPGPRRFAGRRSGALAGGGTPWLPLRRLVDRGLLHLVTSPVGGRPSSGSTSVPAEPRCLKASNASDVQWYAAPDFGAAGRPRLLSLL